MKVFIKQNKISLAFFLILFIIPFFWHRVGEVDYGGDSTRLYFYDPVSWLKNVALYIINGLPPFGEAMPNFSLIPFLSFLSIAKKILFDNSYSLNNLLNGIFLSGSFITVYSISGELFGLDEEWEQNKIIQVISGLFFVLSPLLIYSWERPLYSFVNQLLAYPLVFLFFLKYLKSGKLKFIFFSLLACFFFAMNFSFPGFPWLLAFFFFAVPFLALFASITKNGKRLIKGLLLFFVLFFSINSFDILPNLYIFMKPSFKSTSDISNYNNSGITYFLSVCPNVRLIYNLTGQDQYNITSGFGHPLRKLVFDFGIKFLFLYFFYPITIVLGSIFKNKSLSKIQIKIFNLILAFFLLIFFFMNAGITGVGLSLYKLFFRIPWFSMFRAYYSKFATIYIFFYSLLLGFSLKAILNVIKNVKIKSFIVLIFFILIIFNGWPLLSGKVANATLWRSENAPVSTIFNPDYQIFLNRFLKEDDSFKVLSFPLTNENYQVLKGKEKGVYFGPSTLGVLLGKNSFSGAGGFSVYWPIVKHLIVNNNYGGLNKIFGLLNIGYLFYDNDNYIYDSFSKYSFFPYSDLLKNIFPDQKAIGKFVGSLGAENIFSISTFNLYKIKDSPPLFYVPKKLIITNSGMEILSDIVDFNEEKKIGYYFFPKEESEKDMAGLLGKTDDLFIKAEPQEINGLEIGENQSKEVFYPYVNKRSKIIWKLSLVGEKYKKWLERKKLLQTIDLNIFYANKRLNEILIFNSNINKRIELYKIEIVSAIKQIMEMQDDEKKFQLLKNLNRNLQSNLSRLESINEKTENLNLLGVFILDSLKQVAGFNNFDDDYTLKERNYLADIPVQGRYEILAKNLPFGIKNYSLTIDGVKLLDNRILTEKNGWVSLGDKILERGNRKVEISTTSSINHLDLNSWQEERSSTQKKYLYGEVLNQRPSSVFRLSANLVEEGDIKIIIAEKIGKPNDGQSRLSDLVEYKIIKEATLNKDLRNVSLKLNFSYGTDSVRVFIYDQIEGNLIKENFRQTLSSLRIEEIIEPSIIFKLVGESKLNSKISPKISFAKINPTKFEIEVEGAKDPYNLILSESFDKGWKLYYRDKKIKQINRHYQINGYANMWQILPEDIGGKENYHLLVEYWPQKLFYLGCLIGVATIICCFLVLLVLTIKRKFPK